MGTAHDFIALPNTCQVEMIYNTNAGFAENVFHVTNADGWDESGLNSIAATFIGWQNAHLRQRQGAQVTLLKVVAKDMAVQDSIAIEAPVASGGVGTHDGDTLPANATLAIKWSGGFAGRTKRGRTYHIGLTSTQVYAASMSIVQPAKLAEIVADYNELLAEVNIADQYLSVASLRFNSAWRDTGVLTRITVATADGYVDSQRRRLVGRGM